MPDPDPPSHPSADAPQTMPPIAATEPPPDGFAHFMHLGNEASAVPTAPQQPPTDAPASPDTTATSAAPTALPTHPSSAPPPAAAPATDTDADAAATTASSSAPSFISALFTKATSTLEPILHHSEAAASATLSSASDNLATLGTASTAALSTVSTLVADLGRPAAPTDLLIAPLPRDTHALRTLHVPAGPQSRPLLFAARRAAPALLVTQTALYAVSADGRRVTDARMNITWGPDGASAVSTPPPPAPTRAHRARRPVRAVCAVYLPATDEVVAGHEDGALRIYSTAAQRFGALVRSGPADDVAPATMRVVPGRPARVVVGFADGAVRVVEAAELRTVAVVSPPELCGAAVGAVLRYAPVACLEAQEVEEGGEGGEGGVRLYAGYEDGVVAGCTEGGGRLGRPFVAFAAAVGGICGFFDGVLAVAVGNEADPSLSVFDGKTGSCFVRRMLPYVPSCVSRVPGLERGRGRREAVCPSENAFIVGGEEGQVEIFRVVVLSVRKVELRLVRRVSERVRGREKGVVGIWYLRAESVLVALSKNGELRKWRLNAVDAGSLGLLAGDARRRCTYHEENIADAMSTDFEMGRESAMNFTGGVMSAQNVLAAILDNEHVPEVNKDQVVQDFQRKQAEMLVKVSQADTDLRRARRRVCAKFAAGLEPDSATTTAMEQVLARAVRRTAAFELEFGTRRHAEALADIQASTVVKLRASLLQCLKGIRESDASGIQQIRQDAEKLGREDTEVVVGS